jgi:hypothetical protein
MSNHQPERITGNDQERSSFNKGLHGTDTPPPTTVETPMTPMTAPADTPEPSPPTDYDG